LSSRVVDADVRQPGGKDQGDGDGDGDGRMLTMVVSTTAVHSITF
jgi:hypothetical protein